MSNSIYPMFKFWEQFRSLYQRHTLTQFTGLKDKSGKEIYEGDLIRTDGFSEGLSEPVVWRDCMFQIGEHGICPLYFRKDYEVIGNIYENSELLKEDK
jgi:hypothetical protein